MTAHNKHTKECSQDPCLCAPSSTSPLKRINTETAVLISGILISLAILAHGYLARGSKSTSGINIDKAVIAEIMKKSVAHRYFREGTPTEPIVFTEYSDTECPFCKNFHQTMQELVTEGNGQYAWVYKHFPLSFHPNAQKEAEAIECVRSIESDEMGLRYMDAIFALTPSNNKLPKDALYEIAEAMKISSRKLKTCLDENKFADVVKNDIATGSAAGVEGTPFTFVTSTKNGAQTTLGSINGAQPRAMIDALLAK